jgi:uncharacterized protein DUF4333
LQSSRRFRFLALTPLIAVALVACGDDKQKDLEGKISDEFQKQGQPAKSVDCPSNVKDAKKGSTYSCTVTKKNGQTQRVNVRFVDDDLNFIVTPATQ